MITVYTIGVLGGAVSLLAIAYAIFKNFSD